MLGQLEHELRRLGQLAHPLVVFVAEEALELPAEPHFHFVCDELDQGSLLVVEHRIRPDEIDRPPLF
jgi:hypothetical protein